MIAVDRDAARVPVVLFTGFLGAGKTTLLNHLLGHAAMADSLVVVNELGDIGIDHLLVERPADDMVLLNSGCLCCAMQGDLIRTLDSLRERRSAGALPPFARVLIETTGLADPVPILQTVVADPALSPHYRLRAVVTLVDGVHGEAQLGTTPESVKQAAVADTLILSKADLVAEEGLATLRERLHRLNPGARLLSVSHGRITPDELFAHDTSRLADDPASLARWLAPAEASSDEAPRHAHGERHDHRVHAHSFVHERVVRAAGLQLWLDKLAALRGEHLLRVKGILNVEGEPMLVQVVQTVVHEPVPLPRWPDADRRSRIVMITRDIAPETLARTFSAFDYALDAPESPQETPALDPQAYARFVEAMRGFR